MEEAATVHVIRCRCLQFPHLVSTLIRYGTHPSKTKSQFRAQFQTSVDLRRMGVSTERQMPDY